MRRRRRRGTGVLWFPTLGAVDEDQNGVKSFGEQPSGRAFDLGGNGEVLTIDLTWDFPPEEELAAGTVPSLADWQGAGWRLRRIVGQLYLSAASTAYADTIPRPGCQVTAGLIVLKVDEEDGTPLRAVEAYDPALAINIRDPWIWRRTWILTGETHNNSYPLTPLRWGQYGWYMNSNLGLPGVTGPGVDQKTNRVIRTEERLFLVISNHTLTYGQLPGNWWDDESNAETDVVGYFDYRLVGRLERQSNRRNASR